MLKQFSCLALFFLCTFSTVFGSTHSKLTIHYDNPTFRRAGVLPYALGEEGKIYVLIGREKISRANSSGMWKGFGGRREPGETIIFTALREAKEESRICLGEDHPIYDPHKFPFDLAIITEHHNFKYLQLMVPVEWDPIVPEKFNQASFDNPHMMEKLEVRWVLFEDLYKAVSEAQRTATKENCLPSKIKRIIHVKNGHDFLPLARDFQETLATNYRNPDDFIHMLAKNKMPTTSCISNDLDILK